MDYQRVVNWSGLTQRLESSGAGRLELPFSEIERLISGGLPPSCQYPAFWSNSSSYAKAWKRAGYEATRRGVPTGHMGFVRTRTLTAAATVGPTPRPGRSGRATGEVVLIGCVKTKAQEASPARDLYVSPLFERRRRYAESSGRPWYILSAEHGLLDPGSIIEPYDVYLPDQTADYRKVWGEWVTAKLTRVRGSIDGLVVEVHAGAAYLDAIKEPLRRQGAVLLTPLAELRMGEQLSWYDGLGDETRSQEQTALQKPDRDQRFQDLVILDGPHEIGSFTFAASPRVIEPRTSAASPGVVQALLDYGQTQVSAVVGQVALTPHPEANALIRENPFAFLLAAIFAQGIPAERAWRAPYDLMRRLGHLDPARMLADPEGVRTAVAQPPVLHRYREKLPGWLVGAARIVLHDYAGDAARIWNDDPTARQLQQRLDRFPGIGQKKAAMAVEILDRHLGVSVRELNGSDVAYDVHLRRVFLRSGLAEYDDLDHMVDVARRAYPERPGALDMPTWLIGRQWCHAGLPDCPACVLRDVCLKDIDWANAVRGA
jgi:uncharacterized HhH-GPD family protein